MCAKRRERDGGGSASLEAHCLQRRKPLVGAPHGRCRRRLWRLREEGRWLCGAEQRRLEHHRFERRALHLGRSRGLECKRLGPQSVCQPRP